MGAADARGPSGARRGRREAQCQPRDRRGAATSEPQRHFFCVRAGRRESSWARLVRRTRARQGAQPRTQLLGRFDVVNLRGHSNTINLVNN